MFFSASSVVTRWYFQAYEAELAMTKRNYILSSGQYRSRKGAEQYGWLLTCASTTFEYPYSNVFSGGHLTAMTRVQPELKICLWKMKQSFGHA
ncbi:hypothetical protein GLAREA_05275 [Glarea lozoyensis ATCC 20868]|uniref:Uncharacterized protein n=1 Tax=Glarea lozoyensis (strain ATCC 20868 / MF5171) TaxID=1116229 RepID=S3DBY3_GLAL2|nr:uncharacterized protein GLAREA_05275 [Glarea lozoyensis ATCC 20868]EPE35937.1 hypothetical protein GLAREA_05275 [Glarea lozoyensis ATCC 20868]